MRCLVKATNALLCVFFASFLAAGTALNAADKPKASSSGNLPTDSTQSRISQNYGDLPLSFEENRGQADPNVRFLSRGADYTFFLTPREAVLAFSKDSQSHAAVFRLHLVGSNSAAHIGGTDPLPGSSNYFLGSNPSHWRTSVSTYRKVAYENIYSGINLVYYGNQRQLEYDFVVAPGADPRMIRLAIEGADKLSVDAQGNLVLGTSEEVRLLAPKIYQEVNGQKREIAGRWNLDARHTAGFDLASYDHSRALVIDPVLMYSSFLGGSQTNSLSRIAIDSTGNAYVAGVTASGDFPASPTPQATTFGGGSAQRGVFVAKIDPTGSTLLYSTYLSGSATQQATGLALDASGNAYVTGNTTSTDFPVRNAFQPTCAMNRTTGACSNAFLTKISATGDALLYSTYLGGTGADTATSVAVDSKGSAYVVGTTTSQDFPATTGALQTKCTGSCTQSAFVAKFNPTGESLLYATYLGGSGSDRASDVALDSAGNAYITGHTTSPDFPLASPFQKTCTVDSGSQSAACFDTAFVTKINSDGSALAYSTYLGGSLGSEAMGIAVDALGSAYVTGTTQSADFPVLKPFQKTCGLDAATGQCSVDVFLSKFSPTGKALTYSTYLGGSGRDEASGITLDAAGNAHIVGRTESADFPTAKPLQSRLNGPSDAFVAAFNTSGSALVFSTYHGGSATESGNGIALDVKGNIYIAGETSSPDFPTQHPFQSSCAGNCTNAFVSKLSALLLAGTPATITPNAGTTPQSATVNTAFANLLSATVLDSSNVPVSGVTVTFTAPSTTTTASGTFANGTATTTAVTDINGVATATAFTANPFAGGPYTVTATVSGLTADFLLTNTAGTVSTVTPMAGTTPQSAVVNNAFSNNLAVTVLDGGGKPLAGLTVTFTAPPSGASGTFANGTATTTAVTDINGVATASAFTANSLAGGPYTATGATGGKSGSFSLTNTAGTVGSVTPVAGTTPQSAVVNNAFSNNLAVTVLDGGGKPLAGLTVTFTAPNTTTLASGTFANGTATTTATTDATGLASASVFTANPFAGGPYTVTGATGGKSGDFSLTNTAGTVATVTPVAGTTPQSAVVNNPFTNNLAVTVLDGGGKPLGGLTVTFTAPNTTTAASGTFANGTATTTATTDITGLATATVFTANPFAGGPYTATGATGGKSGSFLLTNTAGTVNTVTPVTGSTPQSTVVNTAFAKALGVTVLDGNGKPLGGLTVTFSALASGPTTPTCTFSGGNPALTTANTDITGVASAVCTTNTVAGGPYIVVATTAGKNANFSLTNLPGPPATITPAPGSTPQSVPVTNTYANALSGTVTDQFGNTVLAGITVTFTPPASGASGAFAAGANPTQTNASGVFTAVFTANGTAGGPYNVGASTSTGTATFNYSLTNTDFTLIQIPPTSTILIQGQNTTASNAPVVTVTPEFGYTGTVTLGCVASSLPSGVTCPTFNPPTATFVNGVPTSVPSAVTVDTLATTPVGAYSVTVVGTDASATKVSNSANFGLSVECTFSLGSSNTPPAPPVPTFTPILNSAANPFPFAVNVTEVGGGSICPWTAAAAGDPNAIPPAPITLMNASGTNTSAGSSVPANFEVTANTGTTVLNGTVTVSYFAAPTTGASVLNVAQESPVPLTAGIGTTAVSLSASQLGTGTLTIPNATGLLVTTVCSAANANGPDTTGNNFALTCAAQVTGSTVQLSVTVSAATPALRANRSLGGVGLLYAASLGFPAIVFLGAGASAFGPKRRRLTLRRFTSMFGVLMVISLLVLLPGCGGGFHAIFGGNQTATYTLTVMGYVADSNNNVTGVEIFAVPLNIVK